MSRRARTFLLASVACALVGALLAAPAGAARSHPLVTALSNDGPLFNSPEGNRAFQLTASTGARAIRIYAGWYYVAPDTSSPPAGFDPTNPFDPNYNWEFVDRQVRQALANGLEPILDILDAPRWAEGPGNGRHGINSPDPTAMGQFALAMARRYSGAYPGLPRVHYYMAWNEPNVIFFLTPQIDAAGNPLTPDRYRDMVNAVADAVHSVHSDNSVVAGELFPFGLSGGQAIAPMDFLRRMTASPVKFDVLSVHPYTQGNAFHHAFNADGVSLGDLPKVQRFIRDASRSGQIVSNNGPVQLWITEFSWDSNPPDDNGVPDELLKRWVPESIYQAWRSGVTLYMWYRLDDDPPSVSMFQSGLFFGCGANFDCVQPKSFLPGFRFPFVAYRQPRGRILVWGRTPAGQPGKVDVYQQSGARWLKVSTLSTDAYGVFRRVFRRRARGDLRAVAGGETSFQFSLTRPHDRPGTLPFG